MNNEIARPKVILDGKQAEQELENLTKKANKLRDALHEASTVGDSQKEKKLSAELKRTNAEISKMKKEAFDVDRILKDINGASFNELSQALRKATNDLKKMKQSDPGFAEQGKKVSALKTKLAELNGSSSASVPLWSRMANGANKYFNMITLGIATLTGIVFSVGQFIKGMVGLDDALADVMKTTGLTRREVRELYVDFRYLNTRTPRAELLALAEEAGRLGKVGKKDIMDFVEVANKIKISLGDDLGGNAELAIREVGKLTEIFRVGNQYGSDFKTSMEKMGSGLNQVANNSNASAEYLIEYMKRLGGISTQAKVTAADIMGYASTFDQLGQNVEMAATAQSKVMVDMFTDPGKYAKIAKMEVGDFSKLLKKDANEAFIKFLEGLNGNNEGLSEMAVKLDSLGIDGARAIQALAVLSSNTKMLRQQQILANDAMEEGTSLNNEYAIKNNNLAGSMEKLGVYIRSKFISSGFIGFLEKAIGKTAEWIEQPVEAKLRSEQRELNVLISAISNANTTQENRNDLIAELQKTYPDFLGNLNAEKVTNEELRTRLEDVNKQYEDRILLMIKEDMLTKNYRERTELKIQELDLIKQIGAAETIATEARKKLTPGLDPNSYRNVLTQKEFDAMRDLPILTAALQDNRNKVSELKAAETDLNNALGELRQNRTTTTSGKTPTPDGSVETSVIPILDAKEIKKASDLAIEALDAAYNAINANLITQYEQQGWTDARFKMQQLIAEQAYLEEKKKILQKYGLSTVDVDNQLNQKRIESQKEFNAAITEAEKDYQEKQDEDQKNEAALIDAEIDATNKALDNIKDHAKSEKQLLEERARNYQMISETIVGSLSSMLDGSLGEYESYGNALILMSLQILKQMAPIWAAQIVGGSLATPDSIMTGGIAGVVKFTAMLAIMEGFISVAEGAVKKGIERKQQAATEKRATGGFMHGEQTYTVSEEGPEWIAPNWQLQDPATREIIDMLEINRRNRITRGINTNAISKAMSSRNNGFASGGRGRLSSGSGTSKTSQSSLNPELLTAFISALDNNTKASALLMKRGVQFPIVPFKKELDEISDLINQTGMGGFKKG